MKVLLLFTFNQSIQKWKTSGILSRELAIYKKLAKKNIKFIFLTYGGNRDKKILNNMKNIDVFPCKPLLKPHNRLLKLLKSLFLLFTLKEELNDVNIIKTNQMEGSWVSWLGKLILRKKLIVRVGFEWLNSYILRNQSKQTKGIINHLKKYTWRFLIELISYKLADDIIITNPREKIFIIKTFKLKKKEQHIHLIYNFIDTDLFKPIKTKKKEKHILFVGRFYHPKNLVNLIKAFKDLNGFTLDLIGDGPLKKKLMELAKELNVNVNFLGRIENQKLPDIINKYHIFILPSFYEGNPKTLLEAMSCGIPCIGTKVWGIEDLIKHEENGYLCQTNHKSIAKAIQKLYENEALREKLSKNARNFILKNCSLESIFKKEYYIYTNLLKSNS